MKIKNKVENKESKAKTEKGRPMQIRTGLRAGTWLLTTAGQ